MEKVKVGIIGCGFISTIYIKNCTQVFKMLELVACADIFLDKAVEMAKQFNIPIACSVDEILSNPNIEIILNLTVPKVHAEISLKALEAGKSVYSEKPLGVSREDGKKIIDTAKEKNLLVGCAPDTFLGGGLQTCRKLLDDGWIGKPIGAIAFMMGCGPESWHPNPDFYYKTGGGPMFDMGPYYLTALISLLGPVNRVSGTASTSFSQRTITTEHRYGEKIEVEVPTHITGTVDFKSGAVATLITSFDVWGSKLPKIEIYGSEGTLCVPDPDTFGGPVYIKRYDTAEWTQIPITHAFTENSRGIGMADMAIALRTGRKNRANGELAFHVLDIMAGIHDASKTGIYYTPVSSCERPEPLPMGLTSFIQD